MAIPDITEKASLSSIWEDLVYTHARLEKNEHARDLAKGVGALVSRTEKLMLGQLAVWRDEVVAQAAVDDGNDRLDETVDEIDRELLHADKGERTARHARYFTHAPNEVIRLGLESELPVVREWPASLASEPEKEIKALAKTLKEDIAYGEAAVAARRKAIAATADHRAREIVSLIDDANAARLSLYGALAQRAVKAKLAKSWPDRFFRHGTRKAKRVAAAVAEPPTPPKT